MTYISVTARRFLSAYDQWRTQKFLKGGGCGAENTIALSGPGNGQKLSKLGLHFKIKWFGFTNIL